MPWNYSREESSGFNTRIPEGKHRVRIKSAEKSQSKKGNDMIILTLDVSGYEDTVYHYITFMPDNPQITNRMLTEVFDSFAQIGEGNFNLQSWVGKVGACNIKHEEYNGNINAKVGRFIPVDKQGELPPWKETGKAQTAATTGPDYDGFNTVGEMEVPF